MKWNVHLRRIHSLQYCSGLGKEQKLIRVEQSTSQRGSAVRFNQLFAAGGFVRIRLAAEGDLERVYDALLAIGTGQLFDALREPARLVGREFAVEEIERLNGGRRPCAGRRDLPGI